MAKCRECKQTSSHKLSCSRRKHGGRTYVDSSDELASNWPIGAVYSDSDYGGGSSYDSGSSCSSSDSSGGSCGGGE